MYFSLLSGTRYILQQVFAESIVRRAATLEVARVLSLSVAPARATSRVAALRVLGLPRSMSCQNVTSTPYCIFTRNLKVSRYMLILWCWQETGPFAIRL